MPNFGMLDALTNALAKPTADLNGRLDRIAESLDLLVELTQTSNRLLAKLLELESEAKPIAARVVATKPVRKKVGP